MADESSVVQDELVLVQGSSMNAEDDEEAVASPSTTPTQDELPQLISSLAPGVSASGIEAAASALRGLPILSTSSDQADQSANAEYSKLDEISDSELAVQDDLGDLASRPVEQRLSNVSSPNAGVDDEDEVSLSGLSSADESGNRLLIRSDVEDGEIPAQKAINAEANNDLVNGHDQSKTDDKDSSDDSDSDKRRNRRRFRKRQSSGSSSTSQRGGGQKSDNERPVSSTSRSLSPRQTMSKKQKELPRYDVRNVINRKRAAKQHGSSSRHRSRSRSRSASRTRSRPRPRRPRSRSKSPRNRRISTRSRSRSPLASSRSRRLSTRSRSRSPPARNRFRNRRKSRSRSPPNKRSLRRSRSPSSRHRSRSRSVSRSRSRRRSRQRSISPQVVQLNSKSKKTTKNTRVSKVGKKKQRSRSRSRSRSKGRKAKKAKNKSSQKSAKKNKKSKRQRDSDLGYFNNASGSSVANKEVFTSGDKIMVSVNFKNAANKSAAEIAATTKPSLVIDIMSSPYQVIEPSPEPIIDVLSEDELDKRLPTSKEPIVNEIIEENDDDNDDLIEHIVESHKGPCTPPNVPESLDLAKGPQTPEEDSYDPCDPTESPELEEDDDDNAGDEILLHSGSSSPSLQGANRDEQLLKTAASTIPFLMEDSLIQRLENNGAVTSTTNNDNANNPNNSDLNDHPVDMDMDSPFSPQSSECSDIFEPPMPNTPKGKRNKTNGNVTSSTKFLHSKHSRKAGPANNNKHVTMKIVDDKLKIIDDVPTSAVEMAVKEKFLKKVQRQERIVEEIKTVLKPYYNRKRITKEDYKDILRKCVPKVCHSKKGDINPTKIQKLVKGYVRKYHHARKKSL